jgi:hypothetical protein
MRTKGVLALAGRRTVSPTRTTPGVIRPPPRAISLVRSPSRAGRVRGSRARPMRRSRRVRGGVRARRDVRVRDSRASTRKSKRLRLRSNPAYNIAWGLPSSLEDARSITPREALLHGIPYHLGPARAPANDSPVRVGRGGLDAVLPRRGRYALARVFPGVTLAAPADGARMLLCPSSQRTRTRGGSSWSTSSITPARLGCATFLDSTTILSPA